MRTLALGLALFAGFGCSGGTEEPAPAQMPVQAKVTVATTPIVAKTTGPSGEMAALADTDRPNVVLIITDDLGMGDISTYEAPFTTTPNIDRVIRNGISFMRSYSPSPVCSPSRASILSGVDQSRHQIHRALHFEVERNAARGSVSGLDPEFGSIMATLARQGYDVGFFGKWHMGEDPDAFGPLVQGASAYFASNHAVPLGGLEEIDFASAGYDIPVTSDAQFRAYAEQFLDTVSDQSDPFFLIFSTYGVHTPIQYDQQDLDAVLDTMNFPACHTEEEAIQAGLDGIRLLTQPCKLLYADITPLQKYYAGVRAMDRHIGALLDRIEEMGELENTIVILTSDNGADTQEQTAWAYDRGAIQRRFRGTKGSLYEAGIRVPLIISWPAGLPAGFAEYDLTASGLDIAPTLYGLLEIDAPADMTLDGMDLFATKSGRFKSRPPLYFYNLRPNNRFGMGAIHSPPLAIISDDLKLLRFPDGGYEQLYDLDADPYELTDLARDPGYDAVRSKLSSQLMAWYDRTNRYWRVYDHYSRFEGPPAEEQFPEPYERARRQLPALDHGILHKTQE